jgi:hypothetical protein
VETGFGENPMLKEGDRAAALIPPERALAAADTDEKQESLAFPALTASGHVHNLEWF